MADRFSEPETTQRVVFEGLEYHESDRVGPAHYALEGSGPDGWVVLRNDVEHLRLGPGYRLLRTERCGVCSTDLARRLLPFPLPQIIGHELIALDPEGQRYVVEINASHRARGIPHACPFCELGLANHCPERRVLGIHDLPGGFGPWLLAPERSAIALPDAISSDVAVLVEPFAAALHAAESIGLMPGDRVAVLGPRRLGLLVVAALAARRKRDASQFTLVGLSRHPDLCERALAFGADEAIAPPEAGPEDDPAFDIVIDTTGSPEGFEKAIALAGREVHLKSTHGQPAGGLAHATELVVDEIGVRAWPGSDNEIESLLAGSSGRPGAQPRVAWLASAPPPSHLSGLAEWVTGPRAADLLETLQDAPPESLPRADLAVVETEADVDAAVRPIPGEEIGLVRPRGQVCILGGGQPPGPLLGAVARRGLRLSTSRCGNFLQALELLESDDELRQRLPALITHRMPADELPRALELARSPDCIKVVVHQGAEGTSPPG